MLIIEKVAMENGGHRNQKGNFRNIPEGWVVVPDDIEIPSAFPFVVLEMEGETLVSLLPGILPEDTEKTDSAQRNSLSAAQLRADIDYLSVMTGVELL